MSGTGIKVGVVVIGRNEGERLRKCLQSLIQVARKIVYVDSGSTDRSVELAHQMAIDVVNLDMSIPFTAARARNAGCARLRELAPGLKYVQFVDGDCEVANDWLRQAEAFLDEQPQVAVVCGRLREKHPEQSIYNLLCDMEWDTPVGETKACGGIAMMRTDAFETAKGFRTDLIAGEEPELCVRLRAAGWRIWRLDAEMALHDAAMTRFGQWWKRATRAGYAFAQGASLHGKQPEQHRIGESRSIWFWGFGIPLVVIGLSACYGTQALFLFMIYPLQVARIALRGTRTSHENWLRAGFLVLGKFPELLGQMKFALHLCQGKQAALIEHK